MLRMVECLNVIVGTIYSPPELQLEPGFALGLTTQDERGLPGDFDEEERKVSAKKKKGGEARSSHWKSYVHAVQPFQAHEFLTP